MVAVDNTQERLIPLGVLRAAEVSRDSVIHWEVECYPGRMFELRDLRAPAGWLHTLELARETWRLTLRDGSAVVDGQDQGDNGWVYIRRNRTITMSGDDLGGSPAYRNPDNPNIEQRTLTNTDCLDRYIQRDQMDTVSGYDVWLDPARPRDMVIVRIIHHNGDQRLVNPTIINWTRYGGYHPPPGVCIQMRRPETSADSALTPQALRPLRSMFLDFPLGEIISYTVAWETDTQLILNFRLSRGRTTTRTLPANAWQGYGGALPARAPEGAPDLLRPFTVQGLPLDEEALRPLRRLGLPLDVNQVEGYMITWGAPNMVRLTIHRPGSLTDFTHTLALSQWRSYGGREPSGTRPQPWINDPAPSVVTTFCRKCGKALDRHHQMLLFCSAECSRGEEKLPAPGLGKRKRWLDIG